MSSEKISLLVPTRGRPSAMRRFRESVLATAREQAEIVYYLDEDDFCYVSGQEANKQQGDGRGPVRLVVGPRIVLSECWNRCAEVASGSILMHAGDDIVFRTPGWDEMVREAFARVADRILFVFGDDGSPPRGKFGTHGFIHRRWIEALGYFAPPYFSSDWNDTWLNEIAQRIGRHQFVPIITEHMHPMWGKGQWDQTHLERLARGRADGVGDLYRRLVNERKRDADKLRAAIEAYALEPADSHAANSQAAS